MKIQENQSHQRSIDHLAEELGKQHRGIIERMYSDALKSLGAETVPIKTFLSTLAERKVREMWQKYGPEGYAPGNSKTDS